MSNISDAIETSFKDYLEASRSSDDTIIKKEPKFYLSDMGKCLRSRWLKRKGIKGIYDWKTYYTFAHGDFIHKLGYKALEAKGILVDTEQASNNEHWSWRYDGRVKIDKQVHLFDFKSTNPYVIKKLVENKPDNMENIMQILGGIILERQTNPDKEISDIGLAIYINKLPVNWKFLQAPQIIITKEYHLSTYKDEIMDDMKKIVDYWLKDEIPPCTCPSWSTQEYNSYWLFCHMTEKEVKTHLKYLKAGNTITTNGFKIFVNKLIGKEE